MDKQAKQRNSHRSASNLQKSIREARCSLPIYGMDKGNEMRWVGSPKQRGRYNFNGSFDVVGWNHKRNQKSEQTDIKSMVSIS